MSLRKIIDETKFRAWLLPGIFILALAPRLALLSWKPPLAGEILTPLNDSTDYHHLAGEILEGRFRAPGGEATAFRPPLYPIFLAGIYAIFGAGNLYAAGLAQAFLGALNAVLIVLILRRFAKNPIAPPAAGILYAIYPAFAFQTTLILSEVLGRTLLLATIYYFTKGMKEQNRASLITAGIIYAAAVLNKSALLAPAPFIFLWTLWGRYAWKKRLIRAAAFFAPAVLIIGAWTIRNAAVSGRFVPVSTNFPITFAQGVTQYNYYAKKWYGEERLMPVRTDYLRMTQLRFYNGIGEETSIGRKYALKALGFIRGNPGFYLGLTARKFGHFWSPFIRNVWWKRLLAALSMGAVLLLGWAGIAASLKNGSGARRWAVLAILYGLAISVPYALSQSDVRYRVGLIDPIWLLFCGPVLAAIISKVTGTRRSQTISSAHHGMDDRSDQTEGA